MLRPLGGQPVRDIVRFGYCGGSYSQKRCADQLPGANPNQEKSMLEDKSQVDGAGVEGSFGQNAQKWQAGQ